MASKKLSAKPTMREAFQAAQGPAVARRNGRGNGQGPAVNRKDREDSDDRMSPPTGTTSTVPGKRMSPPTSTTSTVPEKRMSPPTGTTSTVPEKVKKANKKSYPKIKKK